MFKAKLQKIRQKLSEEKIDAVLISDVSNITFLSGYPNFSKEEREAYLFIGKDFAYIITDARYTEEVRISAPHLTLFERSHQNPTENLFKKHKVTILGIEENNLTVTEHKFIKKHFKKTKHFEISRSTKTKQEIKKIQKACEIGDLAFKYILKKLKFGVTEKELAAKLEDFIRSKGAVLSFPVIAAYGANSAIPHHHTGNKQLEAGDFVLLDFGVKYENYCSDMTRTVVFGKQDKKQKEIYKTVLNAQQKAVDVINDGERKAAKVFESVDQFIKSKGFPAIPHSLGHGIGLEVHEHPHLSLKSKDVLREGMVFSIEPGIYIPDFGGVRIEDLFVLEKKGLRKLTSSSIELEMV